MRDPDSSPQVGVPTGAVTKHTWSASRIYPGATHDYWVYVPAQYSAAEPACVTVFQDGQAYVDQDGPVKVPVVFDNLIHKGEMPVTIGVFVNPGAKQEVYDQRQAQYVPLDETYARFLLDEILPQVAEELQPGRRPCREGHLRHERRRPMRLHRRLGTARCLQQGHQSHRELHQASRRLGVSVSDPSDARKPQTSYAFSSRMGRTTST